MHRKKTLTSSDRDEVSGALAHAPIEAHGHTRLVVCLVGWAGLYLFGCARPPDIQLPTVGPVPSPATVAPATLPPPPKSLIVCLRDEPASLYLYSAAYLGGVAGAEIDTIFQAIYDGPLDIRDFEYQPVILEKAPSIAGGDARIQTVMVSENQVYFDPVTLQPESLNSGQRYLPAGCGELACAETYSGGEVALGQLVVDFVLIEDLRWSDGEPLTAADSVFSYQIDAAADTPSTKFLVNHTQSYEAIDDRTVRWTGIPGFMDNEYRGDFWSPLPVHLLGGRTAAELLQDVSANQRPIGWGPYEIDDWQRGSYLRLIPNPFYFRAQEGLPAFDTLEFRFLGGDPQSAIEQLTTGECDVLDESLLSLGQVETLNSLAGGGRLAFDWVPGSVEERLEFDLAPANGTSLVGGVETRRALAACIDRQGIVDDILAGAGQVGSTYIPTGHPLYIDPGAGIAYDPAAGMRDLEAAGWTVPQASQDSVRQAGDVQGVNDGTRLALKLVSASGEIEEAVARRIVQDLAACGAEVSLETYDPGPLLAGWPDGPVFGRSFDLALWAWPTVVTPVCEMFASGQIASEANPNGINASGFNDPDYDAACGSLLLNTPDSAAFAEGVRSSQEIFAEQLPALPLFLRPRLIAYSNSICGIVADPSSGSLLWNLEDIQPAEACQPGS